MRQLIAAALCILTASAGAQDDYTPPTGKLVKMVVVSRHAVYFIAFGAPRKSLQNAGVTCMTSPAKNRAIARRVKRRSSAAT